MVELRSSRNRLPPYLQPTIMKLIKSNSFASYLSSTRGKLCFIKDFSLFI